VDANSPADSEWDRILLDFEQQRKKLDPDKENELETSKDSRPADSLWILQAEQESSSEGSDSDLGDFLDDMEIEDSDESKKIEDVGDKASQLNKNEQKLRKALAKIRRLDKLLAQRVKREKEVKEQRSKIEKELQLLEDKEKEEQHRKQQQYGRLTDRHKPKSKEAKNPKSTNNDTLSLVETDSSCHSVSALSPVFTTQPGEAFGCERMKRDSGVQLDVKGKESENEEKRVDFIKRNIELAADAASAVAMTDEEKRRLDELLIGLPDDKDYEEISNDEEDTETTQMTIYGEGFRPGENEAKELQAIESQLNALVPGGNWEEHCSSSVVNLLTSKCQLVPQEGAGVNTEECNTENESQEKSWSMNKAHKDSDPQTRLKDIDQQLEHIKASREAETTVWLILSLPV
jgi:hypothetical protein